MLQMLGFVIRPEGLEPSTPCLEVSAEQPILLVLRGPGRSHSGLIRLIRKKLSSKLCSRPRSRNQFARVVTAVLSVRALGVECRSGLEEDTTPGSQRHFRCVGPL